VVDVRGLPMKIEVLWQRIVAGQILNFNISYFGFFCKGMATQHEHHHKKKTL
jgi:hypothetical protein